MILNKLKGFLMAEGIIALAIAIAGVSLMALVIGEGRSIEQRMELKTDRAYAWHILKKLDLKEVKVHDRVYELRGASSVYDKTSQETYLVKK
ncbi:hypothetical protein [Lactobacillus bombicola]|jgi:hypothetical protein|uniref:Type II secretion system protein n=2 Tax=Lactobacillus bombicola TaxID=1505723 RepID=A0A396SXT9_9LACO|nr:hypothetical protein [Lactobacillus bombicola]RHW49132.1 hypothetical protein DS833_06405 [Lactobacillus bombicola]RHW53414.1 hypothetical protein DS834_00310 [Lactobacillus bombicola]RHW54409.1 hypothetical protein DS835_04980 [Lactobacillus bombicola]